jgi:hypothetical protein
LDGILEDKYHLDWPHVEKDRVCKKLFLEERDKMSRYLLVWADEDLIVEYFRTPKEAARYAEEYLKDIEFIFCAGKAHWKVQTLLNVRDAGCRHATTQQRQFIVAIPATNL